MKDVSRPGFRLTVFHLPIVVALAFACAGMPRRLCWLQPSGKTGQRRDATREPATGSRGKGPGAGWFRVFSFSRFPRAPFDLSFDKSRGSGGWSPEGSYAARPTAWCTTSGVLYPSAMCGRRVLYRQTASAHSRLASSIPRSVPPRPYSDFRMPLSRSAFAFS